MRLKISLVTLFAFLVLPLSTYAQDADGPKPWGSEFGVFMGSLLPYMIPSVTEIQPFAGARYATSLKSGALEGEFASSNAHGVTYQLASISYRGEIIPMPDLATIFYIGPDFHRITTPGAAASNRWGFHVGAGGMMHIGGPVWFRTDMRFNSGPGTSLYLLFGLSIRTSGEASGD